MSEAFVVSLSKTLYFLCLILSEEWLSDRVLVQPRKYQDMTEKLLTVI